MNFFQAFLRNCINCVHCDHHFFIFISFPQFIYDLFHISLTLIIICQFRKHSIRIAGYSSFFVCDPCSVVQQNTPLEGVCPGWSKVPSRSLLSFAFMVCTARSTSPLDCAHSGDDVTCSNPQRAANSLNSVDANVGRCQ